MVQRTRSWMRMRQANGPQRPLACSEPLTYGNTLARSFMILLSLRFSGTGLDQSLPRLVYQIHTTYVVFWAEGLYNGGIGGGWLMDQTLEQASEKSVKRVRRVGFAH